MYTYGGKTTGKRVMYNQRRACFSSRDPKAELHQPWTAVGAWFLGPKAENDDLFQKQAMKIISDQIEFRKSFFPCDPVYVTDEMKQGKTYQESVKELKKELTSMTKELQRSVPFFSSRYKVSS